MISGLLAVMVLSFIYFYWINKQSEGKFFEVFFGYHHWVRAMGNGALRSHPPWFYVYQFFTDFAPWSPIFYGMIVAVFCTNRFKLSSLHYENHQKTSRQQTKAKPKPKQANLSLKPILISNHKLIKAKSA